MVETSINRVDPSADEFTASLINCPGGGDLRLVAYLLGQLFVQGLFLVADVIIAQSSQQVIDTRRDELVGVQHLNRVFLSDATVSISKISARTISARYDK